MEEQLTIKKALIHNKVVKVEFHNNGFNLLVLEYWMHRLYENVIVPNVEISLKIQNNKLF